MLEQYQQALAQHRQRIYSFARYSLRAAEDAEDITQEVFIKLWQHWQKVDHDRLGAWLMRVAHNAVIDHVRKHRNANASVDRFVDVEQQSGDEEAHAQVEQDTFQLCLQAEIKSLDEPFRSIIIMRDIQDMSYSEIQESLQLTESQVKVYLHRGRRKLRESEVLRQMFETMSGREMAAPVPRKEASRQAAPKRDATTNTSEGGQHA